MQDNFYIVVDAYDDANLTMSKNGLPTGSDDLDAGKWIISLQETKKKPDLLWSSHHQCVKRDYSGHLHCQ